MSGESRFRPIGGLGKVYRMRVFVTGGTGLVGRAVVAMLLDRGDEVLCLTRDPAAAREVLPAGVEILGGRSHPARRLAGPAGHLRRRGQSGRVARGRWMVDRGKKQRIRRSRLATTENVVEALAACDPPAGPGQRLGRGLLRRPGRDGPGRGQPNRAAVSWPGWPWSGNTRP